MKLKNLPILLGTRNLQQLVVLFQIICYSRKLFLKAVVLANIKLKFTQIDVLEFIDNYSH